MADILRRQKDQIRRVANSYLNTTTTQYLSYFDGSPTYLIYYRQATEENILDKGLETVHSFYGNNSPKKYDKINDLQVWGIEPLDPSTSPSERGILTTSNGELLFLPNCGVIPYNGDYFVFNYDGLREHLFVITDTQFDKLSNPKFYRCSFSLVNENSDVIEQNLNKEYDMEYSGSGVSTVGTLVESSDSAQTENIKEMIDKIIDRYTKNFYDEDMDTFIFHSKDGFSYWSPYLQHFLHETKALKKYKNEILTEIYIMDIDETDYSKVYNEIAYRNSIFKNIENCDKEFSFDENFLVVDDYDLKMDRNLPFFMSRYNFKLVSPIVRDNSQFPFMNAFPLFLQNEKKLFKDYPHEYKVHKMDDLHIARLDGIIKDGDIIFECNKHELEPTKICIAVETEDENKEKFLEIRDASIEKLIEKNNTILTNDLFKIFKDYLNGDFKITDNLLNILNKYYYANSLFNFIMIPLVIYILKNNL